MTSLSNKSRMALLTDIDSANARIEFLEAEVTQANNLLGDQTGRLDRALNRATRAEDQRDAAWNERDKLRQHPQLNERKDFESLTRAQLISLIEGAINEARRKSMVEAEGLVAKHRELTDETDLETMRGVVLTYQSRIAAIEADKAAKARAKAEPIKLDTRPLADKLAPKDKLRYEERTLPWYEQITRESYAAHQALRAELDSRPSFKSFDDKARQASKPKYGTLAEGSLVVTAGDHGTAYSLQRKGNVISCSCPSWQRQLAPNTHRTCKHLGRFLGFSNEEARVGGIAAMAPRPSCRCGVILVNGQCQVHTQYWKGEESCECGRSFWFCKEEARAGIRAKVGHVPRLATK